MDILLIGGTVFLGRHLVDEALGRGHRVTVFHRGRHPLEASGPVEEVLGDRDGGLEPLRGRRWDAAIDTCGYVPRLVRDATTLLADRVGHYTFISTISVYAGFGRPHFDEAAPVGTLRDAAVEEVTNDTYGPLKALCEQAAEAALPGRALVLRPGMIVGPHDPTDRFTYWARRVARGGEVLAPGRPEAPQQFIDVRDLAAWNLDLVERGVTGVFNVTGPAGSLSRAEFLEECRRVSRSDARFTWVDDAFLVQAGADDPVELPFWAPDEEQWRYIFDASIDRALAAGLAFRPSAATIEDTLIWDAGRPADVQRPPFLGPEREAALLAAWRLRA